MKILISGLAGCMAIGLFLNSEYKDRMAAAQCDHYATEWAHSVTNASGQLNNPTNREYYAVELAKATVSCPNGHILIGFKYIPAEIKALADSPAIIEKAQAKIQRDKEREESKA